MRVYFRLAALFAAALLIGLTGLLVVSQSRLRQQTHMLDDLQKENEALRDELTRQRELLRDHTLQSTRRSPDEFLALFPSKFPDGDWQPAETRFEDCWFTSSDGLSLHGWYLRHPKPRGAVLHLHGNAGNLSYRAPAAELLYKRYGVSVMLLDYRGYGRSEGTPTMLGLLRDARAARAQLAIREAIAEKDVVLLGESIGGAVAVDLAAEDGARGLILESTFASLREVAGAHYPQFLVSMLVADRLNSVAKIGKYNGPLLQVHGDADQVIPLTSGRKLFEAANEPKTLLVLPQHDHNSPLPEQYYEALGRFFERLPATR
jgi:fermentation-respiration switch protein FrsA (DUF1100 family)